MVNIRSGRIEEKRQKKRIAFSIVGVFAIFLFFALFGIKLLVGFSLLVDKLRGTSPTQQTTQNLILPPVLDPLPMATKSASLIITGRGDQNTTIVVFLNEKETEEISPEADGTFEIKLTSLVDGANTISAKSTDSAGNASDLSNVLTVNVKKVPPVLELSAPEDRATITGDSNKVPVQGKTEENTDVTVNGHIVVVHNDNTFSYDFALNEGENKLTVVATDSAGNTTTVERTITYHR